ncbi:MAG: leucyl aminopeptidase [Gammaproteobacteria bacterium]|nr:leucyl aminopeptidase [Gammaproteobacteria bacterium]
MKFVVKAGPVARQRSGCLILPVFAGGALPTATADADRAAGGFIRRLLRQGDFRAEAGDTLLLPKLPGLATPRVLLAGLGARERCDRKALRKAVRAAFMALGKAPVTAAVSYLGTVDVRGTDAYRRARIAAESWHDSAYRFLPHKTRETGNQPPKLRSLALAAAGDTAAVRRGLAHGDAIGRAISLARDLGNEPPNVCTPSWLAQRAREVAGRHRKLRVQVLDEARMRRLGMGSLLSVTAGSAQPARFVVMQYQGARAGDAPVVFVGKGITFDTGGISLKPGPQMDEMKYDMSGAGTVIAVMQAVAELGLPVNVVGLVPSCENMPGGRATRPGDIVRSMSGQTIEILNTDAEGRLILCDALTYGARFKPAAMIDIATLTGACVVALGKHRSGLMGNSDPLATALLAAGDAADDPAWRLPLDAEYMELLKSPFADVANIGGRDAGTITAAAFLSRFAGDTPWAHLDVAGTAWVTAPQKGSTGRPVGLLVEYLLNRTAVS